MTFDERLKSRAPLLLDGALGTELERRGVTLPPPLWSAAALGSHPDIVREIHADYAAAGVDILVANTFRTNPRALRAAGWFERGPALNRRAIELVREALRSVAVDPRVGRDPVTADPRAGRSPTTSAARQTHIPFVAASIAPVEDCYSPHLVPDEETLLAEHRQMIVWLRAANPDLVWIETMGTAREARAAARAAYEARLPAAVSFVLREDGALLGGESLEAAVAAVEPFAPVSLGLNCIPPRGIDVHLPRLRTLTPCPVAVYAHINIATPTPGWSYAQCSSPAEYADTARRWIERGANIVGGCCGTTPEHIRALSGVITESRAVM